MKLQFLLFFFFFLMNLLKLWVRGKSGSVQCNVTSAIFIFVEWLYPSSRRGQFTKQVDLLFFKSIFTTNNDTSERMRESEKPFGEI